MQLTTSILLATATLAALGHAEERQDLQNPKNTKLNCVGADPAHVRRICSNLQGDWTYSREAAVAALVRRGGGPTVRDGIWRDGVVQAAGCMHVFPVAHSPSRSCSIAGSRGATHTMRLFSSWVEPDEDNGKARFVIDAAFPKILLTAAFDEKWE
ncbi:uncharacterized protein MYCGRDRAFT_90676 [Zymoseptoria tritici IPO323]|uniref:Uncharacterized protein n=1 Tax=Zymoseptoria tritici (strain CBS 115943 / IPO323) TaxID=336722 RepID=F9X4E1_ZYMTI|nr:uncharacterized protein MYCGRDRAFT_90676 [Zymoseptoria tritici IPO323]EGP90583.1 hypothetical protein MYCGRDRAFT_90676 [Zymoseptoria tritici IPO323]